MNKNQLITALPDIFYLADNVKRNVMWKEIDEKDFLKYFKTDVAAKSHNELRANTQAGAKAKDGYIRVQWKGKKYSAHHIAFALQNGDWPKEDYQIDHETRDRSDQSKLIQTTAKENAANRGGKFDKSIDYNSLTDFQRLKLLSKGGAGISESMKVKPSGFILKKPFGEMMSISRIELFGPNLESLSARTEYSAVDKELIRQEVDTIGFTFFEPLQVVRVRGQLKNYLADGLNRLRAYQTDSRFGEVPVTIWEVENENDLGSICKDISAEYNTRPFTGLSQKDKSNGLYDRLWQTAIIDKTNKIVKWNEKVAEIIAKYRVGSDTAYYMRNIIKHFVKHDIEKESYYEDRFIFNERKTVKDESVNMEADLRRQMTVDYMAEFEIFRKSKNNILAEICTDGELAARLFIQLFPDVDIRKAVVAATFNLNAPISPKKIDPIKLNPTKITQDTDRLDWD